jgi:hypothetical protein
LHRPRHVDGLRSLHELVGATVAEEHSVVHEAPHALLEEEGVTLGPCEEERLERLEAHIVSQEALQQLARLLGREGVEPELTVVGLPAPAVPVLGAVVDEQQEPGCRQALDQAVEDGLRLRVDPVEVLDDHEERLDLALPQEESLQGVDRALPPLWWGEGLPCAVFDRYVEERQDRRQRRLEGVVEREELRRDLLPDRAGFVLVTHLKVVAEEVHHRKVGRGRAVRDGGRLQDQPAVGPVGVRDLPHEP